MRTTTWVLDDAKATCLIKQGASVTEVAERLKVSRQTVYKAIRKGRIPAPQKRLGTTPIGKNGTPPSAGSAGTSPIRD
jgi:excisionase family DNA binding protein